MAPAWSLKVLASSPPVLDNNMALATVMPSASVSWAALPASVTWPVPRALLWPTMTVPPLAATVTPPSKVLAVARVSVPAADLVNEPVPEITLAKLRLSERLISRMPELAMAPAPMEPVVEPAPICSFPAEIVIAPPKVLAPERMSVPAPDLVSVPVAPEMTPACVPSETVRAVEDPSAMFPPLRVVTTAVAPLALSVPVVRVVTVATPPTVVVPPLSVVTVAAPVIVLVPPVTEPAMSAPATLTTPSEMAPVTVAAEPKVVLPAPESEASVMIPVVAVKFSAFASVALALVTAPTF